MRSSSLESKASSTLLQGPRKRAKAQEENDEGFRPSFFEECDRASLENNTHLGRLKQKRKPLPETTLMSIKGGTEQEAVGFHDSALFFIDTLKDEFCEKQAGGWYTFKEPPEDASPLEEQAEELESEEVEEQPNSDNPYLEQPKPTVQLKKKQIARGRWTDREHQLFLEALKLFGKDWKMIHSHVGSRDIRNIRSHAQKFLNRLVQFLEGKKATSELTIQEAEFYAGILTQRVYKTYRMDHLCVNNPSIMQAKQAIAQLSAEESEKGSSRSMPGSEFEKWKVKSLSNHSSGHSIVTKKESVKMSDGSERQQFSFKSVLGSSNKDQEVISNNSESSEHLMMFNVANRPVPFGPSLETKKKRKNAFLEALSQLEDIESDDEDPEILMEVSNIGLQFNVLKIDKNSFMRIFYSMQALQIEQRMPNLYKYLSLKINEIMDEENAFDKVKSRFFEQNHEDRHLSINLKQAASFFIAGKKDGMKIKLTYVSGKQRREKKPTNFFTVPFKPNERMARIVKAMRDKKQQRAFERRQPQNGDPEAEGYAPGEAPCHNFREKMERGDFPRLKKLMERLGPNS